MDTLIVILKSLWFISLSTGFLPEFLVVMAIGYFTGYYKRFEEES